MKKELKLISYIICMLAAFGCQRHLEIDSLEAVGDSARVVAYFDLEMIAKSCAGAENMPAVGEIEAIGRLRGVDMKRVAAVSYTPSQSALIWPVTNPRMLRRRLDGGDAMKAGEESYFVADSAWLWMVDARTEEAARAKVAALREKAAADTLAGWKKDKLIKNGDASAIIARPDRYVLGYVSFIEPNLEFHVAMLDSAGHHVRVLPQEDWGYLSRHYGLINSSNNVSVAVGRLAVPEWLKERLNGTFLEGIDTLGQFNLACNIPTAMRFTMKAENPEQAAALAESWGERMSKYKSVVVESENNEVSISSLKDAPALEGTSYAGANIVVMLNAHSSTVAKALGDGAPGFLCVAVGRNANFDGRIDFNDTDKPFLATLFDFLGRIKEHYGDVFPEAVTKNIIPWEE